MFKFVSPLDSLKQRDLIKRTGRGPGLMEGLEPRRLFAAGDLDPTLSGDGSLTTGTFGKYGRAWDVAVQNDGKLVIAGAVTSPSGKTSDAALIRYNANGTLDTTFGAGGVARLDFGGNEHFRSLRILADGKILVGGTAAATTSQWVLARYNVNGTLDTGSGFGGTDGFELGAGTLVDMTLDRQGRIITASSRDVRRHIAATGALDAAFGSAGTGIAAGVAGEIGGVAEDNGNGIVVSGQESFEDPQSPGVDLEYATVTRLTNAGVIDSSYGDDGTARFGGSDAVRNTDLIQSAGATVLLRAGYESHPRVFFIGDGGNLYTDFGTNGYQLAGFLQNASLSDDDVPMRLVSDAIGNVYVAGYVHANDDQIGVRRILDEGDIDTSFGDDGVKLFTLPNEGPVGVLAREMAIALAPGNRLVIAGNAVTDDDGAARIAIARLDGPNPEPAPTAPQIAIEGGVLVARGTMFTDVFSVRREGGDNVVIEVNATTASFDIDDFTGVRLEGFGGNDTFNMIDALISPVTREVSVRGGTGDDTVSYATRTAPVGFGPQPGEFSATSSGVTDTLHHVETLIGGSGNDSFSYGDNPFLPDEEENSIISFRLEGRGGNDNFVSRWISSNNVKGVTLYGGDGDDRFEQNDLGGRVFAEAGDDRIVIRSREANYANFLDGGSGVDLVIGAGGNRSLLDLREYPNIENADVSSFEGVVIGNDLANRIDGTDADASITIKGLGGNDTLIGSSSSDDLLEGGDGNDSIVGNQGDDTLDGGAGDDTLTGGPGGDTYLNGEVTDDDGSLPGFTIDSGNLSYDGTAGDDQVSIWADGSGGLVMWLDGRTHTVPIADVQEIRLFGNGGNDLLKINLGLVIPATLVGGEGDDRLIGGAGNDSLNGGGGNDHMSGNGGNDTFEAGAGADTMIGGAGKDTANYSMRGANLVIGLDAFDDDGEAGENDLCYLDIERVLGGFGNDRIGGGDASNELYGNDGNDTISGGGGNDALFGAAGNDKMDGGDGSDYLEGGAGHDTLYGGPGGDTLYGLAGNDRLLSDGDDTKDTVSGGIGTDSGDHDELDEVSGVEILI